MASGGGREASSSPKITLDSVSVNTNFLNECLRDSCQRGDVESLKSLLADCDEDAITQLLQSTTTCSGTPLCEAIVANQQEVVRYLLTLDGNDLEQECDINIFYPIFFKDNCTALCLACAVGEVKMVEMLLQSGGNVNHPSLHSSPLIYASEYNNVDLLALLLQYGADMNVVPRNLHTEASVLPLYQACLFGHKDTAELLLNSSNVELGIDKKVALLGLLGAQCINRHQDYESGLKLWKQALQELQNDQSHQESSPDEEGVPKEEDIATRLQRLYLRGHAIEPEQYLSLGDQSPVQGACSIFHSEKLCTTMEELDELADDETALSFQGLLVLECILGPTHPETTQQVSHAARLALEKGDFGMACRLFMYIIKGNEQRDQTATAMEYASQLADLLLKAYMDSPHVIDEIDDCATLLLSALCCIQESAAKTYDLLDGRPSSAASTSSQMGYSGYFEVKQHSKVKLLSEMVESFMAFLRLLMDQELTPDQQVMLHRTVARFLSLGKHRGAAKYNIEPEVFKIAVFGGQSTSSTLYFFQEELFPQAQIANLLLKCGGNVNCQDNLCGDSPLHFSIDCPKPDPNIISILLDHDAHMDIYNRYGVTPYTLLQRLPELGIVPGNYVTLKCMAARAIMAFGVPYKGQVPKILEDFIPWHGIPTPPKTAARKTVSLDNIKIPTS